ncbi:unnamed protein product [Urochloa decumbens]|uniref:Uncharacterized protein n=1 Tax=Urochloa decumbens TaxID=240449 RepID=A0ABC9H3B2_9POAL
MASASGVWPQPPRAGGHRRSTKLGNDGAARFLARRPEEKLINDYAVLQATARKIAIGLAYLSLTWSTVVLLGGFVSNLELIDFWFLTAISTVFAVNLADIYEYKIAFVVAAGKVYNGLRDDLARGFQSRGCEGLCLFVVGSMFAEACFRVLTSLFAAELQILGFAPLGAIFLSLLRLGRVSYGNAGGDAAKKLKASLQIFYTLALAQNFIFCIWILFLYTEDRRASAVSRQCRFGDQWGHRLVKRYLRETRTICTMEGYVPLGRNLITFAVSLLGSESMDGRRSAVRMLDAFVENKIPVGPTLLPSKDGLENLLEVLEVGNGETRERAARVVAALAGDLRHIDQFPLALDYIASLLQASEQFNTTNCSSWETEMVMTSMQEDEVGRKLWRNEPVSSVSMLHDKKCDFSYGGPKQHISQGLLIVERLAMHQGNCAHICSNHGLLSRITAPLTNSHAFLLGAEYDSEWIDILSRSLRIVARLISAPGEACRELRSGIAIKTQALANLTGILEQDDKFDPVLTAAAIEILAELASDKSVRSLDKDGIKKFISQLWGIFLAEMDVNNNTLEEEKDQEANRSLMRYKAGEALARMLAVWGTPGISSSDIMEMFIQDTGPAEAMAPELLRHVVGELTDILTRNNRGSRTRAAEILVRLCSHFTKYTELPRQDVIKMLTKVLQLIIQCIPRESNNNATAGVGANNNHAAQHDVENPRPAPGDDTGNGSSSRREYEKQQEEKEFMVALLSLAVVICDRMIDAQDFTSASGDMLVLLVTKLKEIIETNSDTTVEFLSAVKLSCQLIVSMLELQPSCIIVFMEHNFKHVLSGSLKSLSNLDTCMLFDAEYHQVTRTDKPLASLVKQAQERFDRAQELGNGPA